MKKSQQEKFARQADNNYRNIQSFANVVIFLSILGIIGTVAVDSKFPAWPLLFFCLGAVIHAIGSLVKWLGRLWLGQNNFKNSEKNS